MYGLRVDLKSGREAWDKVGKVGKSLMNKLGFHPKDDEKPVKGFHDG